MMMKQAADAERNSKPSSMKDEDAKVDGGAHHREGSLEAIEVPSSSQATEEDDDVVLAREIQVAMELPLNGGNAKAEDPSFYLNFFVLRRCS